MTRCMIADESRLHGVIGNIHSVNNELCHLDENTEIEICAPIGRESA